MNCQERTGILTLWIRRFSLRGSPPGWFLRMIFDCPHDAAMFTRRSRYRCVDNRDIPAICQFDAREPVLLDVTRLVALGWMGRRPTGIDRVCLAYLRHFRVRAWAVVQHRGVIRVFGERESADLLDLLENPEERRRTRITRLLSAAIVIGSARLRLEGMAYLNIGHTDFDLAAHSEWVRRARVRSFYFLHDLIPVLHPEFSRPHAVRRHRGRVKCALKAGAGIILGSEAVKQDLEIFAADQGLPSPPLIVAHLAGEDFAAAVTGAPAVASPYFLCVGTVEPRKNHRLLFAVWQRLFAQLGERTPRLVIVGQTGPMTGDLLAPLANASGWQSYIEHRRDCSDSELAGLLHHAQALLVPSLAEGFGLPFVEALQARTPVIASDLPVFREIGQSAAQLLDPHDCDAWAKAIAAAAVAAHQPTGSGPVRDAGGAAFVPPRWSHHFSVVERFIAAPAAQAQTISESILCA